jgi:hypothetical protein
LLKGQNFLPTYFNRAYLNGRGRKQPFAGLGLLLIRPRVKAIDLAPNFHPVAARVWQLLASYTDVATGQGAEPLRSAASWPRGGENWLA